MIAVSGTHKKIMTNMFLETKYISQMWVETEFKVSKTLQVGRLLSEAEQDTFKSISWFNRLRSHQADDGMPLVMLIRLT